MMGFSGINIRIAGAGCAQFIARLVDRLMAGIRDPKAAGRSRPTRRWRLLQVEPSLACNLRCIMCPWVDARRSMTEGGRMPDRVWMAIQPFLDDVESVDFTGGGEPLMEPHLIERIAIAKNAGCQTGFLTNGLLLDEDTTKRLLAIGIDWIGISMDGADAATYEAIRRGSSFERVCDNMTFLTRSRNGKTPMVMINFVLMHRNLHQIEEMIRLAAKLGVDQVNFKQCDVIRGEHGKGIGLYREKDNEEIASLKKKIDRAQRLARKLGLRTTAFAFTPDEKPVCVQDPRSSLFIRYDGTVAPCINLAMGGLTTFLGREALMPTVHYGNITAYSLEDIRETNTCKYYREVFEARVNRYRRQLYRITISPFAERDRLLRSISETLPEPPAGCKVCHYLYDI